MSSIFEVFYLSAKSKCQLRKIESIDNAVAIVGTRRITPYGKLVTTKIATELTRAGITIISGFMYGVDQTAQQAALAAGGKTIGVLGYGFDQIPNRDKKLFKTMLKQGATFISEYPPDQPPQKWTFVKRNRIIAALARATVVTEAAAKSGSLITAQFALDYNREVCAVPGPITSPFSEGTKALINQGATLVSSGAEVLEATGLEGQLVFSHSTRTEPVYHQLLASRILEYLKTLPVTTEQLIKAFSSQENLSKEAILPQHIMTTLTYLEMQKDIINQAGKWHLASFLTSPT